MSGVKIEMTGADGAEYHSIVGLQSRLVVFPDGITRHITLNNWHWEVFDRSHEDAATQYLLEGAYLHALEFWLQDSFKEAAAPRRGLVGQLAALRDNASDITDPPPSRTGARFDARLRRSLVQMISVAMADVTGRAARAND